jgi:hypothetical protein
MSIRPAKYGRKTFTLVDVKLYYTTKLQFYVKSAARGSLKLFIKIEDLVE